MCLGFTYTLVVLERKSGFVIHIVVTVSIRIGGGVWHGVSGEASVCWGVLVQYPVCVFGLIINHCEALPRRDAPHLCAFSHLDRDLHLH